MSNKRDTPDLLTTRAYRRQHLAGDALLEWFRERNFEEDVVLSFRCRRATADRYFQRVHAVTVEFGRTICETVPYGAVVAPSLKVPTRKVGWPHAHLGLQYPVESEDDLVEIASKHLLTARFERGPGLLARVCGHMDRLDGAYFMPFFVPSAHLLGPARAMEELGRNQDLNTEVQNP